MSYVRIAFWVIIASLVAGLSFWVWLERRNAAEAVATAATAQEQVKGLLVINEQQSQVNAVLANQRTLDDKAVSDLNAKLDTINEAATAQAQALADLEKDPNVKAYVDTPVPPGLARVRN